MLKLNLERLSKEHRACVEELVETLSFEVSETGILLLVEEGKEFFVKRNGAVLTVGYRRLHEIFRGISLGKQLSDGECIGDELLPQTLCFMPDLSRNAVYNLPQAKQMVRWLAVCGFDSLMLYTEDTYELAEYPYFGYMRGRLTVSEMKELDDYAAQFGIEIIPCVQMLAHLATAIRWPGLASFRDTPEMLLVGDERTYRLAEEMLKVLSQCFRSRRINLGMDEAHNLGLGRYLTLNGYRPKEEIMAEHLARLVQICVANGYAPMMWSDMFYRMTFRGLYYVSEGEIPTSVIESVPKEVTLIYWDYFAYEDRMFRHMVDTHLNFHNPIAFAGGAWKWSGFAPHNRFSLETLSKQLPVIREKGIDTVIATAWADDGAEASQNSVMATVLFYAEACRKGAVDPAWMEARAQAVFGIGYEALLCMDAPNELPGIENDDRYPYNPCKYLLYNDPMEGFFDPHLDPETAPAAFAKNAERLRGYVDHPSLGYAFRTLERLCLLLEKKCDLGIRIRKSYRAGDKNALRQLAEEEIPEIIRRLDAFLEAFRYQWHRENKPFGFSTQEIRLGGVRERLTGAKLRLEAYCDGKETSLPELEQEQLPFGILPKDRKTKKYIYRNIWKDMVTGGLI